VGDTVSPAAPGIAPMAGVAIVAILGGMGGSALFRGLLLRRLERRHPTVFAELGRPSARQLTSLLPKHGELQVQFWKYLWGRGAFSSGDKMVSALAAGAVLADLALLAGVVLLFWVAAR
jgi:hypothetical protein